MNEQKIIQRLLYNEKIAKKFYDVETRILTILNYKDFFEVLLIEIAKTFEIPYVWFSLIKPGELSDLIKSLQTSEVLITKINIIEKDIFFNLMGHGMQPILENNYLDKYAKLIPDTIKKSVKSMAMVPISMDGGIIGSLNFADRSYLRYSSSIDATLLEQLGLKASLCLSNVTAHEKLKFLAYHDPLTGLLNRRVMETALKREFNRATRYDNILSVVFVDLDNFKRINDKYGHDAGDKLLRYVADKFRDQARESDVVAKFAGDEFVIILPETTAEQAKKMMTRHKFFFLENPLCIKTETIPISISYGIASTEKNSFESPEQFLKKADEMLYLKKNTKNQNTDDIKKQNVISLPVTLKAEKKKQ